MSSLQLPDLLSGKITLHFHETEIQVDKDLQEILVQWLLQCAEKESLEFHSLDYILSNDQYVLELNKQYLDHDYFTDILTFPMDEESGATEIYISLDRVKENAVNENCSFEKELARVMIHGILHLTGHMDSSEEERDNMRNTEDRYLNELSFKEPA